MPAAPPSATSEGYRLEGSSTNFDGSGTLHLSSTTDISVSTLTLINLDPYTTYFFRVGSLNWNDVPHYQVLDATSSLSETVTSTQITNVYVSSASLSWSVPASGASGYRLEAATSSTFIGTIYSTATTNNAATTLTVMSLLSNTTFYFRIASLNWNNMPNFLLSGSTKTLSSVDVVAPNAINDLSASTVSATSMLLNWTAPSDPTDDPLNGSYFIQFATWTGVAWSTTNAQVNFATSAVVSGTSQGKIVAGLDPNTTFYFHIWTQDIKGQGSSQYRLYRNQQEFRYFKLG